MLNSGVNQALGHFTEELKSAFLSAYAILDKVGLFLNDYYQIGHEPGRVSFQWVWYEKPGRKNSKIHPCFQGNPPWLLTGLHFLSKDLFDENFFDVMEPDAANLARIRHLIEHRFLSVPAFSKRNEHRNTLPDGNRRLRRQGLTALENGPRSLDISFSCNAPHREYRGSKKLRRRSCERVI